MNAQKVLEYIKLLDASPATSGDEKNRFAVIKEKIGKYFDEDRSDNFGNLIFRKGNGGKKIMICVGADDYGVIATHCDGGKVSISPLGDIKPYTCTHRLVKFSGGAMGVLAASSINESSKVSDFSVELFNKDEVVESGEKGYFCSPTEVIQDKKSHVITGTNISVKCAVATLMVLAESFESSENEIYFAFLAQDKLGHRGACCVAGEIMPDEVYVIGCAESSEREIMLRVLDKSYTADSLLLENIEGRLDELSLPYKRYVSGDKASAAGKLCTVGKGCRICQIDLPIKNFGTCQEVFFL